MTNKADTKTLIREMQENVAKYGRENTTTYLMVQAINALQQQDRELEAVGAGGVNGPLMGRAPKGMVGGLQVYRCKIKSRKQIDREIPRELQGWWADVAAGQKLLLRRAVQSDLDRCTLGGKRSRNPADYMCETHTNGSLVSKVALEYMNPEENVFAAPPTTSAESKGA